MRKVRLISHEIILDSHLSRNPLDSTHIEAAIRHTRLFDKRRMHCWSKPPPIDIPARHSARGALHQSTTETTAGMVDYMSDNGVLPQHTYETDLQSFPANHIREQKLQPSHWRSETWYWEQKPRESSSFVDHTLIRSCTVLTLPKGWDPGGEVRIPRQRPTSNL